MPQNRRLVPLPTPQLEVIHAGDDTVRAELIALPVPVPVPRHPLAPARPDATGADAPRPAA